MTRLDEDRIDALGNKLDELIAAQADFRIALENRLTSIEVKLSTHLDQHKHRVQWKQWAFTSFVSLMSLAALAISIFRH